MTKYHALSVIEERDRKKYNQIMKKADPLVKERDKQYDIIDEAGRKSQRGSAAVKEVKAINKKIKNLNKQEEDSTKQKAKDKKLVYDYGEDAMNARGFNTDRGVDYSSERRTEQKPYKVQKGKPKATGGYVKKYADGGGVRKVRR
mgnify:CR=1 FL=1